MKKIIFTDICYEFNEKEFKKKLGLNRKSMLTEISGFGGDLGLTAIRVIIRNEL